MKNVIMGFLAGVALLLVGASDASARSPMACLLKHELAHAGGWSPDHRGFIYERGCGQLPMPPRYFPPRFKPIIHYVSNWQIYWQCGYAQACTYMYTDRPAVIWLPNYK